MGLLVAHDDAVHVNYAALLEASGWISEDEFERMHLAIVGPFEPETPLTVIALAGLIDHGRLPDDRWRHPKWREPEGPRTVTLQSGRVAHLTGPVDLELEAMLRGFSGSGLASWQPPATDEGGT